ncbi:hypothetical protein GCM10028864_60110 [Microlunatus parietis]
MGRLVLKPCEAFDNFPPGRPGRLLGVLSRIPGGLGLPALVIWAPEDRMMPPDELRAFIPC